MALGALGVPWGPGFRAEAAQACMNARVHTTLPHTPPAGPHAAEDLVRKGPGAQALKEVGGGEAED